MNRFGNDKFSANSCQIAGSLSESISITIAATSEATLGTSNREQKNENNSSGNKQTRNHVQTSKDCQVDGDVEILEITSLSQALNNEPRIMRMSSTSDFEKRITDKTQWGHIDPRTEWPEWPQVVCDEDMDAVLAARRARNRQLGKWLEKCPTNRPKLTNASTTEIPYWRISSK